MSWSLYRWTWRLAAPLYVGAPPAGALNRCRLYVPARAIWGAVTAELARKGTSSFPEYSKLGARLREEVRFTYLYPAQQDGSKWRTWLPRYETGEGLCWRPEDDNEPKMADRELRCRLLDARPGTAIDPHSDSASEGSLRETECIQMFWRTSASSAGAVALTGYIFVAENAASRNTGWHEILERLGTLFVGGDTRYGLGRLERICWEPADRLFGKPVELDEPDPITRSRTVFAHTCAHGPMAGAVEVVGGWDVGKQAAFDTTATPLWAPGSVTTASNGEARFRIDRCYGLWQSMQPKAGR